VQRSTPLAAAGLVVAALGVVALASGGGGGRETGEARAPPAPPPPAPVESAAARALREGRGIDVNTAGEADLVLLPRIGPALARRIVAEREAHGPFRDVDDLGRVRGIGPRTIERLRPLLRAGPSLAPVPPVQ
jgi:competence protein ComEA